MITLERNLTSVRAFGLHMYEQFLSSGNVMLESIRLEGTRKRGTDTPC